MTAAKDISRKKLFFPENEFVLAGFEPYTSTLSRYSANHYTHRYLLVLEFEVVEIKEN